LNFAAGTSVSVYGIFSCLNPGTLSATYTVDGATIPQTYNATSLFLTVDREETPNFLYYSLDNLSAGDHTLVVNITAANNQTFILDYITYTPSFATLSLMPLLSNTMSTTTSTPLGNPSSSQLPSTAAIIGGVIGALALGALFAILGTRLFLRRRKAKQTEDISQDLYASIGEQDHQQRSGTISPFPFSSSRARYGWADVKYARRSNPAVQAAYSHLRPSLDPPPNVDNPAAEIATASASDPPPYDALSSVRPVTKHITAI